MWPTIKDVFNMLLLVCRCTRVKVIRVEVSQNVVHARTTGWMTSTRAGKVEISACNRVEVIQEEEPVLSSRSEKRLPIGSGTFDVRLN